MKIREVLDKKIGDKKYTRYIVILPKDIIQDSRLLGKELKAKLEKDKIIIEKEEFCFIFNLFQYRNYACL